jgi:hypothetical protein
VLELGRSLEIIFTLYHSFDQLLRDIHIESDGCHGSAKGWQGWELGYQTE